MEEPFQRMTKPVKKKQTFTEDNYYAFRSFKAERDSMTLNHSREVIPFLTAVMDLLKFFRQ